jgi:nitrogen regulatory protein P-II 1
MKLIKCVVRTEKVDETTDALRALDISGLTVSRVGGHGTCERQSVVYRGVRVENRLLPKAMIDVVAHDDQVDDVVRVVTETARTGEAGDGRIFVMSVEQAYSIRTRQGGMA